MFSLLLCGYRSPAFLSVKKLRFPLPDIGFQAVLIREGGDDSLPGNTEACRIGGYPYGPVHVISVKEI